MSMTSMAVSMSVAVEKNKSQDVDDESGNADIQQEVDFFDLVRMRQSLDRLDEDGEAESDEEHRVDESTEHFSTCPAVRVLSRVLLGHLSTSRAQLQRRKHGTFKKIEIFFTWKALITILKLIFILLNFLKYFTCLCVCVFWSYVIVNHFNFSIIFMGHV